MSTFKVVVVGGGTAGWMTAAYLSKALDANIEIKVVESSAINTIGVGEATFSTLQLFFKFLELKEEEWMPECHASYKLAIKFVDWNRERRHFYHPFQKYESIRGRSLAEWWLKLKRSAEPFDYACFTVPTICDELKSPRHMDGRVFDQNVDSYLNAKNDHRVEVLEDLKTPYPYAYHFDAALVAKFMAGYAKSRGVKHLLDEIVHVKLASDGSIASITTKDNGELTADLYVDCTGFRGLLINQALGEPFISFAESLLCDCAIAMQLPSEGAQEGIKPYTTATALSSGWVWNIPLFQRIGTGYVYCSTFRSPEEAEFEFRSHLGPRSKNCKAAHIKMRIGRNRNSWVKNCVAIGLSSGFVEPLESTGIFFIQHGIEELVNHFPSSERNEESIKAYNKAVGNCIDGVRDFLTLHYLASTRADTPFWQATKHDIKMSSDLAERWALWRHRLPTNKTINPNYHGFEAYSYSVMLLGLGYQPARSLPTLDFMDHSGAVIAFEELRKRREYLAHALPSQYEYLASRYERVGQKHMVPSP
jgi:tryptophan 6-halogenase